MTSLAKNQLTLRLTSDLNNKLTQAVQHIGISKNAFIIMLLTRELEQNNSGTSSKEQATA